MLLTRISRHLRDFGIKETSFGRRALGDPNFVRQLRSGRQLRPRTIARVVSYLNEQEKHP